MKDDDSWMDKPLFSYRESIDDARKFVLIGLLGGLAAGFFLGIALANYLRQCQ